MSGARRLLAALAIVAASSGLSLAVPGTARAADPTFQAASASFTFGESITVEQRVTLPSGVTRIEAYVRTGFGGATFLSEIANPGEGAQTLRYAHDTPGGSMFPNTAVEIGFRVTLEDGTFVDGPPAELVYEDDRFDWKTLEGDLVRFHWYEGNDDFGRRALEIGERAVEEATTLLGVTETEPIDLFAYADREPFYDVIGASLQENVGGLALTEIRTLFANIAPSEVSDAWVSIVVPHELTHVVFATATRNPYHQPVHWLDEGLADYLAQGYPTEVRDNVRRAVARGDLMPLHALALQFPSTPDRFSLSYDESVSAIDYLIRTHGQEALVKLIRSYADGVSDDAAFEAALGVDVAGFEAGWLQDLEADTPVPYGPKPAPVGPLPPGWNAAPLPTGPPVATPPPAIDDRTEMGTTIVIGVIILFAILIVLGIMVAARGLNRGESLLQQPTGWTPGGTAPGAGGSGQPARWSDRDDDRDDGSDDDGDEAPEDLSELDSRFAPPSQAPDEPPDPEADDRRERDR